MTDYARSLIEDWNPLLPLLVTDICVRVLLEGLDWNVSSIVIDEKRRSSRSSPLYFELISEGT
jgi:hypothetical protein